MDNITPPNFRNKHQGNVNNPNQVSKIQLNHLGQPIEIDPNLITQACEEAAKNAYNIVNSNDEEQYKTDMEELHQYSKTKKRKSNSNEDPLWSQTHLSILALIRLMPNSTLPNLNRPL